MGIQLTGDQALAYLRAMKMVATKGGKHPAADLERETIEATAKHVLHLDAGYDGLEPISPEQLARVIEGAAERESVIQFLTVVPYLTTLAHPDAVEQVNAFAKACGVEPHALKDLNLISNGKKNRLLFDYARRSTKTLADGSTWHALKRMLRDIHQHEGDKKVAKRYAGLGELPEGTLGRELFEFYRARGFPLPGEKGCLSEDVVPHDCAHVLGGFNTDNTGELNVAAMEAGMVRKDGLGFEMLMEVLLDFQLGIAFTTNSTILPAKGAFSPEGFAKGFAVGEASNKDLLLGWDPSQDFERTVDELREEFGIRPVVTGRITPPPDQAAAAAAATKT